eukprot:2396060-Rhodomonas_salina.3
MHVCGNQRPVVQRHQRVGVRMHRWVANSFSLRYATNGADLGHMSVRYYTRYPNSTGPIQCTVCPTGSDSVLTARVFCRGALYPTARAPSAAMASCASSSRTIKCCPALTQRVMLPGAICEGGKSMPYPRPGFWGDVE